MKINEGKEVKTEKKGISSQKGKWLLLPYQQPEPGFNNVFSKKNAPLRDLTIGRLRLTLKDEEYTANSGNREVILYALIGQSEIKTKGSWGEKTLKKVGERADLFGGPPAAVLISPNTLYKVKPISRTVDVIVASAPVNEKSKAPYIVRPQDVEVYFIGEQNYRREVRAVFGEGGPSKRLKVGETINLPGHWSSWPRHSFDHHPELAPKFEEVFFYFTKPREGWALQRTKGLFCNQESIDDVWFIKNGDTAILPLGDHPVVAGPDTTLLYVWFYLSPISKIYPKWAEDVGEYAR